MGLLGLLNDSFDLKKITRMLFQRKAVQNEGPSIEKRQEDGDYEEIREDLSRLEKDGGVLTIEDLRKTFKNGFVAVKGLSVKMYTG